MLTSAKVREPWYQKLYFLKLYMDLYLRAKFQVCRISLTGFRQGVILQKNEPLKSPRRLVLIAASVSFENQMKTHNIHVKLTLSRNPPSLVSYCWVLQSPCFKVINFWWKSWNIYHMKDTALCMTDTTINLQKTSYVTL